MPSSRSLRPLGGWDLVSHGRFETQHDGHVWTVDLDYFDFGEKLHLYRDGVEAQVQKSPATFHLDASATIEASMGLLGMRRADLVADGETTALTPVEGTAEEWRLRLARERPGLSRLIGVISWAVLVVALVYEVPQLIALIGAVIGLDFDSPIVLPGQLHARRRRARGCPGASAAVQDQSLAWLTGATGEIQPSSPVGASPGRSGFCAAARFRASFLAFFSSRRSRSLRSRLSFAIVVFLLPLEAMLVPRVRRRAHA